MKKTKVIAGVLMVLLMLSSCATSKKIQVTQIGDNNLSCSEIRTELEKLSQAEDAVEAKKGFNGTNVAAALFWLPGLAYTYYDAGQATEAIEGRRSYLSKLYNSKDCN